VYAFGVVAYQFLTGSLPFPGRGPLRAVVLHRVSPPWPTKAPAIWPAGTPGASGSSARATHQFGHPKGNRGLPKRRPEGRSTISHPQGESTHPTQGERAQHRVGTHPAGLSCPRVPRSVLATHHRLPESGRRAPSPAHASHYGLAGGDELPAGFTPDVDRLVSETPQAADLDQ
jgi:hypothetical protein